MADINAASLFDLKAEVLRKKKEAEQARDSQTSRVSKDSVSWLKTTKTRKEVYAPEKRITSSEDVEALAKSQATLEHKSRLYDRLQRGEAELDDKQRESYMVDFDRKGWDEESQQLVELSMEESDDPVEFLRRLWSMDKDEHHDDEKALVEYIDEFGRSRWIKAADKAQFDAEREETQRILFGLLQENNLEPSHYDATGEIRDKGIGFFAFSRNEEDRQRQMKALNELRKKTAEARAEALIIREQRRLEKQSRRARLEERKKRLSLDPNSIFSKLINT